MDGESVEIEAGWNMVVDVTETAVLEMLMINGRLSFQQDDDDDFTTPFTPDITDITVHAHHIFVHAGEFLIGSETNPFQNKATIVLHGEQDAETVIMDGAVESGNKVVANTGLIAWYGKTRSQNTRLKSSVIKGQTDMILVEPGLDWV